MPAVPGGRPARPGGRAVTWPLSAGPAGPRRRSLAGTPCPAPPAFPTGRAGPPVGHLLAERLPHVAAGSSAPRNLTATVTMPQRTDDLPRAPWRFGRSFQACPASARRKTSTPGQRRN
jgi:hypothetical protein